MYCPEDSYQAMEGQTDCMSCPDDQYTEFTGAKNESDCKCEFIALAGM